MSKDEDYTVIELEDLTKAEELAVSIVMREGALRFKEKLVEHLKSISSVAEQMNFIDEVENFDENEAIK